MSLHPLIIVFIHVLALVIIFIPTIVVTFFGLQPFQRGFYCDDESIRYPYTKGTVPFYVVGIIGIGIPLVIIVVTEIFHERENLGRKSNIYKSFPEVVINIYMFCGVFLFGVGFDQMLTNSSKFLIGRLRPHFINACQVDFSKVNCSNHNYVIIDDTYCFQQNSKILKDMRLSFPSGHSSCSAYCAVAFTIYLIRRWNLRHFQVLRVLMQALFIGLAVMCALSRVSDYKHHWSDVLAGLGSGTVVAIVMWYVLLRVKNNKEPNSDERHHLDGEMRAY